MLNVNEKIERLEHEIHELKNEVFELVKLKDRYPEAKNIERDIKYRLNDIEAKEEQIHELAMERAWYEVRYFVDLNDRTIKDIIFECGCIPGIKL